MAPPKGPGGKTTAPSKGDKKSKPSTGEADEFGGSGSARVSVRLACVAVAVAGLAAAASGGAAWPWAETEADAWIRASSRGEAAGDLCGVIAAPAAVRRELESLLDAPSRARGRVLLASGAGDDVVLVRAHGRVVLTRPRAVAAATADQALLAADYECAVQGSPRFFSDSSDRVRRLRAAVVRMDAHRPEAEPLPAATLAALRNDVEGVDLDLHGLWVEALLPSAALVATADTALLRAARRCDARGLRALLQLGADAAETYDSRDLRPLDVAVQCNARGVFAAAREVAVGCGAKCVNFGSRAPRDGLAPLHRALLRHASSFFAHRPEPNPWNMLAHIFMHEGANLTAPTLQTARETPLHICAAKGNFAFARILLDALRAAGSLESALAARDYTGSAPLAVSLTWKVWAVTIPRLLAAVVGPSGAGDADASVEGALKTQALDAIAATCARLLPSYDGAVGGFPLLASADALARCGFVSRVAALLLDAGAALDAADDFGRTALHHAHPLLVPDSVSLGGDFADVHAAMRRAFNASADPSVLAQLVEASRAEREAWHDTATPGEQRLGDLKEDGDECDVETLQGVDGGFAALFGHASVKRQTPLLVYGALGAEWDAARRHWADRAALLRTHGGALVRAGPIPYASAFDTAEAVLSVGAALGRASAQSAAASAAYARGEPLKPPTYIFEQIPWKDARSHPLGDVVVGDAYGGLGKMLAGAAAEIHNAQFYAGDRFSGAPAHYHAHALNALVAGKKRWLLFSPRNAAYSKIPAALINLGELRAAGVAFATCVQPAGAAIYVPAGWGHAVINLEENTVGAAFEFHVPGEVAWANEDRAADVVQATRRL